MPTLLSFLLLGVAGHTGLLLGRQALIVASWPWMATHHLNQTAYSRHSSQLIRKPSSWGMTSWGRSYANKGWKPIPSFPTLDIHVLHAWVGVEKVQRDQTYISRVLRGDCLKEYFATFNVHLRSDSVHLICCQRFLYFQQAPSAWDTAAHIFIPRIWYIFVG